MFTNYSLTFAGLYGILYIEKRKEHQTLKLRKRLIFMTNIEFANAIVNGIINDEVKAYAMNVIAPKYKIVISSYNGSHTVGTFGIYEEAIEAFIEYGKSEKSTFKKEVDGKIVEITEEEVRENPYDCYVNAPYCGYNFIKVKYD